MWFQGEISSVVESLQKIAEYTRLQAAYTGLALCLENNGMRREAKQAVADTLPFTSEESAEIFKSRL